MSHRQNSSCNSGVKHFSISVFVIVMFILGTEGGMFNALGRQKKKPAVKKFSDDLILDPKWLY